VSRSGRWRSPTVTMTSSRITANSPLRGEPSVEIVAVASIVLRFGSTAQTTVREAW
jgi:hypothetical protein